MDILIMYRPYVAPNPADPETGLVSENIDASVEYVTLEQDKKRTEEKYARESSIGLGYRVPLVIASPWSRGGAVCSQVFDHTSVLQFLEKFCSSKTGKQIKETNISCLATGQFVAILLQYSNPTMEKKLRTPVALAKDSIV